MKARFLFAAAAVMVAVAAFAAQPQQTNVWVVAGASSCSFEFRFTHPKGQIQAWRKSETAGKPRTRIYSTLTLLPGCARSWVWDCERGTHVWRGNQLNLGDFGAGPSFETNVWYRARVVQRENTSALLVHWAGAWREMGFYAFRWPTTWTALSLTTGMAEVRNVKAAPSAGRARLATIEPGGKDVLAEFATGYGHALVKLDYADGTDRWMYVMPRSEKYWCTRKEKGGEKWYERPCRDCRLQFSDPSFSIFSPARVWAHRPSERAAAIDYAARHPEECVPNLHVKLRFGSDGSFWVNGKFMGGVTNKLAKAMLYVPEVAPKGERLATVQSRPASDVLRLDPADCCGALRTDDGRAYLDISTHRQHSDPGQETDHYFDRDGLDGFKDSFVWSVPNRCWATARIVAAIKPNAPSNDVPVVTVRLAHNNFAGYGDACAEGQIDLRTAPKKPVGQAKVAGKTVTLYACEVAIPVGTIQDRLYVKRGETRLGKLPFLHVDVLGPLGRPGILWDNSHKPDWKMQSSALVFGLELVESPCEMELLQSQPGLIFADNEPRKTDVRVKANKAGAYKVLGTVRDWDGKTVKTFAHPLTLAAGEEKRVPIDLGMGAEGWYALELQLASGSTPLITHNCSFADVGPDTRKAGFESPYSFWWTVENHGGTADLDIMGPVFKKMGIRRLSAVDGRHTEASLAKYGLTLSQIPFNIQLAMSAPAKRKIPDMVAEYEKWMRKILADFPHVEKRALVFHESYCGGRPNYLWGGPDRKWSEGDFKQGRERVAVGTALCKMMREKFPDVKIQLGNSSVSYEILDILFRLKFPSDLFDYLGSETVARFCNPEAPDPGSGPASLVYLNQVADHYGYPQRANVCYEWVCHLPRELTPTEIAEWGVKDALLAFAAGATMVPVGGTTPDDCYFNSDYGGCASVDRYPYLYPTRGYVAKAMMTRELDCATFARRLPTGSQTVNALEFTRGKGSVTYAMWLPRGEAQVKLIGKGFLGREGEVKPLRVVRIDGCRPAPGTREIALGRRPVFVTCEKPLVRAEIVSRRTPPEVTPRNYQLADALDDASRVALAEPKDRMLNYLQDGKYRTNGVFAVTSGEKCIVLTRDASKPIHVNKKDVAYVALKNPIPLKGKPATLSLEVDGNSSWAEVFFYVEDAEGKLFTPTGIWYEGDARAHGRVNFDGWGTLQFPLTKESRVKTSEVDARGGFWQCDARGRKTTTREIVYPIKLVGFGVSLPRNTISGGVLEPIKHNPNVLRFRTLGAFE